MTLLGLLDDFRVAHKAGQVQEAIILILIVNIIDIKTQLDHLLDHAQISVCYRIK